MPSRSKRCTWCHVTGQNFSRPTFLLFLQIFARLLLAVHFSSELVSKLSNWTATQQEIADAGLPAPSFMLGMVVTLLAIGTPFLVLGIFMRWAVALLLVFQVPTTVLFESTSWYEQGDSISVMGGLLLALIVDELQRPASARGCAERPQPQLNGGAEPLLDPCAEAPILVSQGGGAGDFGRRRALSDREGEVIV